MTYTPDWDSLAHALKRVMATGASEDEAKTDLCRAMADRKIDVRVRIAASDYGMRGQVFSDGNVGVPAHLEPRDFDWVRSRPLAQWPIGPRPGEHYEWVGGWKNRLLDLIELSTRDVLKTLCGDARHGSNDELPVTRFARNNHSATQKSRGKSRPAFERAQRVIKELYPDGVPDQAIVSNKNLCKQVSEKLKEAVSPDTILRAAGRRK